MFKKIFDLCLKLSCGVAGAVILFLVSISAGTMSALSAYEYKMPTKLLPKDDE